MGALFSSEKQNFGQFLQYMSKVAINTKKVLSSEKAKKLYKRVADLALKTPASLGNLLASFNQMKMLDAAKAEEALTLAVVKLSFSAEDVNVNYDRASSRFVYKVGSSPLYYFDVLGADLLMSNDNLALSSPIVLQKTISIPDIFNDIIAEFNKSLPELPSGEKMTPAEISNKMITGGAYFGAAMHYKDKHGIVGSGKDGCCGMFLGAGEVDMEFLRQYAETLNAFAKTKMIEDILAVASDVGFKASGSTDEERLKSLMAAIPNVKKNGAKFPENAKAQEKICRNIAMAINKNVGKIVIDPQSDAAVICQQVAELMSSLQRGMQIEFAGVQEDLKRVMRNILVLKDQLNQSYAKFSDAIEKSSDKGLAAKSAQARGIHKLILEECDRQLEILRNLLSVTISPADERLKSLIEQSDDLYSIIEKIDVPGKAQFAQTIGSILTGMGVTAEYALVIKKSLDKVGMTIDEYVNSPSIGSLKDKISAKILEHSGSDADVVDYFKNAELLYKNFSRRINIGEQLSKIGAMEENIAEIEGGMWSGGATYTPEEIEAEKYGKSKLELQIEGKKLIRDTIFKTFSRTIDDQFYKVLVALKAIVPKIGTAIPLVPELDGLRESMERLRPLLAMQNAYMSLVGYYGDAVTKMRRDRFLFDLRSVKSWADHLAEMAAMSSARGYFQEISGSIDTLVKTIDTYSDKVAQKFGAAEGEPEKKACKCECKCEKCEDGMCIDCESCMCKDCKEEVAGGAEAERLLRRIPIELSEMIKHFDYYFSVAQMRENTADAGRDLDKFAEKYDSFKGEAIAAKVDEIRAEMVKDLDLWEGKGEGATGKEKEFLDLWKVEFGRISKDGISKDNTQGPIDKTRIEIKGNSQKFIKKHAEARIQLWRTAEAVDEYMRLFTKALVNNYNDVRTIKAILENTEVIHDFYRDDAGKYIHRVMDSFPAFIKDNGILADTLMPEDAFLKGDDHYYKIVSDVIKGDALVGDRKIPGNPFLFMNLTKDNAEAFERMKHVTENLAVLKNICSVFVHIGDKIGNEEIMSKCKMTPLEVYKNLQDYIEICSFDYGMDKDVIELSLNSVLGKIIGDDNFVEKFVVAYPLPGNKQLGDYVPVKDRTRLILSLWMTIAAKTEVAGLFETTAFDAVKPGAAAPDPEALWTLFKTYIDLQRPKNKFLLYDRYVSAEDYAAAEVPDLGLPDLNAAKMTDIVQEDAVLSWAAFNNLGVGSLALQKAAREKYYGTLIFLNAIRLLELELSDKNKFDTLLSAPDWVELMTTNAKWARKATAIDIEGVGSVKETKDAGNPVQYKHYAAVLNIIAKDTDPSDVSYGSMVKVFERLRDNTKTTSYSVVGGGVTGGLESVSGTYKFDAGKFVYHDGNKSDAYPTVHVGPSSTSDKTALVSDQQKLEYAIRKKFGIFMRGVIKQFDPSGGDIKNELAGHCADEDELFVSIIKAMTAKVLTFLGIYDLKDRPDNKVGFTPTRVILGGAQDFPEVIMEATPLYIRLPLIMEFYRELFDFYGDKYVNIPNRISREEKITLLPEAEGTWAGLFRMFFKLKYAFKLSNYTENELKDLIREVNLIWKELAPKASRDPIGFIIRELVAEVNRRYGIISKKDFENYTKDWAERYKHKEGTKIGDIRPNELPLLPGEEDSDYLARQVLPSQKFETVSQFEEWRKKESGNHILKEHKEMLYKFRSLLDSKFMKQAKATDALVGYEGFGAPLDGNRSFKELIRQTQRKLQSESDSERRFKCAATLIQGHNLLSKTDVNRYLLFHETVITGLNAISGIYSILSRFHKIAYGTNPNNIFAAIKVLGATKTFSHAGLFAHAADKSMYENYFGSKDNGDDSHLLNVVSKHLFVDNSAGVPTLVANFDQLNDVKEIVKCYNLYNLLNELIELVYSVGSDLGKYVTASIDKVADKPVINLNFAGVKQLLRDLLEQVKYFSDLLAPHIDKDVVAKYTDKNKIGSVYWFEEQIFEKLFSERPVDERNDHKVYYPLEYAVKWINETLDFIKGQNLGQVFAKQIFFDAEVGGGKANDVSANLSGDAKAQGLEFDLPIGKLFYADQGGKDVKIFPKYSNRYRQLYSLDDTWVKSNSLLLSFNQTIAKYLQMCFDSVSEKIPTSAINGFINGPMANSIQDLNKTFPDYEDGATGILVTDNVGYSAMDKVYLQELIKVFSVAITPGQEVQAMQVTLSKIIENTQIANYFASANARIALNIDTATTAGAGGYIEMIPSIKPIIAKLREIYIITFGDIATVNANRIEANARIVYCLFEISKNKMPIFLKKIMMDIATGSLADRPSILKALNEVNNSVMDGKIVVHTSDAIVKKSIFMARNINDISSSKGNADFKFDTDPSPDGLLFTSIAFMLRNITQSRDMTKMTNIYLADNLAEISSMKKEEMKAKLPMFKNLFSGMVSKAEFLRRLMMTMTMERHKYGIAAANLGAAVAAGTTPENRSKFNAIIDKLIQGCNSMLSCIDSLARELGDEPKGFELMANFVHNFKSQNGFDPLMPLSSLTQVLQNHSNVDYDVMLPIHSFGTDKMKYAYATRYLLNSPQVKVQSEMLQGFHDTVNAFNLSVRDREVVNKEQAEKFATCVTQALRLVNEIRNVKGNLSAVMTGISYERSTNAAPANNMGSIGRLDMIQSASTANSIMDIGKNRSSLTMYDLTDGTFENNFSWQLKNNVSSIVNLSESVFKEDNMELLAKHTGKFKTEDANKLPYLNLIDLNIVPINVHAMMRDIPLANLYNYAYNFDRVVIEVHYGFGNDFADFLIQQLCDSEVSHLRGIINRRNGDDLGRKRDVAADPIDKKQTTITSSKEMFIAMLLKPYRQILSRDEWNYVSDIFTGDSNLRLDRPKFLSDEVYNKVLFGELYGKPENYNPRARYGTRPEGSMRGPTGRESSAQDLTYLKSNKGKESDQYPLDRTKAITTVALNSAAQKDALKLIGKLRFQTVFIRNLVFIMNLYRTLRLKLRDDLAYNKNIIVNDHYLTREEETEFKRNETLQQRPRSQY